ncbi:hypothetical protein EDB19DRAFT_1912480 [Suillus lakei]|nr:hypothetical protein EDB19DRAFT_1912480 [Suillus lakei]
MASTRTDNVPDPTHQRGHLPWLYLRSSVHKLPQTSAGNSAYCRSPHQQPTSSQTSTVNGNLRCPQPPSRPTSDRQLGGEHLVNSLVTTVERLARTTDTLSLDVSTTLASTTLLMKHLMTTAEQLSKKTDILSSDVSTTLASTMLLIQHLMTTAEHLSNTTDTLVDNLIATTNALALNIHYLVQGCIVLVALLCFLTVLCIVRWCYAFSRELRGVQHIKTA